MKKLILFLSFYIASFATPLDFTTLQGSFIQTVTSNDTNIDYYGDFYARNDNKALWEYHKPTPKKIYFDTNHVIVLEDALEQAIISKLENTPNLANLLSRAVSITEMLYKAEFNGIEYLVTIKNDKIDRIDYQDGIGNKIKIVFQNLKKDQKINDEKITPIIPSYYDIIRQ